MISFIKACFNNWDSLDFNNFGVLEVNIVLKMVRIITMVLNCNQMGNTGH